MSAQPAAEDDDHAQHDDDTDQSRTELGQLVFERSVLLVRLFDQRPDPSHLRAHAGGRDDHHARPPVDGCAMKTRLRRSPRRVRVRDDVRVLGDRLGLAVSAASATWSCTLSMRRPSAGTRAPAASTATCAPDQVGRRAPRARAIPDYPGQGEVCLRRAVRASDALHSVKNR